MNCCAGGPGGPVFAYFDQSGSEITGDNLWMFGDLRAELSLIDIIGGENTLGQSAYVVSGEWVFFTASYDYGSARMRLWKNGALQTEKAVPFMMETRAGWPIFIGLWSN